MSLTRAGLLHQIAAPAAFVIALGLAAACPAAEPTASANLVGCTPDASAPPDKLIAACDAALAVPVPTEQRARLLFARAYAHDAVHQFEQALPDLDEAIRLKSDYAAAFHERAFARSSLGRFADAITDIDVQLKLEPDSPEAYQERAFSNRSLGRFEDAFADWSQLLGLRPKDAGALIARAGIAMWLGRFDQAKADLRLGESLAGLENDKDNQDFAQREEQTLTLWTAVSGGPTPEKNCEAAQRQGRFAQDRLIGDCTLAFLKAKSNAAKADALTTRYMAYWVGRQDPRGAVPDAQMAAAIESENADRHVNLGFVYIENRHSWAAVKEFDRAIALKSTYPAYAGRASAKFNRSDFDGAFADAKASFEMKPNILALTVLGDLAMDKLHDPKAARQYWMGAYQLGDRGDGLVSRLKSIGVVDPDRELKTPIGHP